MCLGFLRCTGFTVVDSEVHVKILCHDVLHAISAILANNIHFHSQYPPAAAVIAALFSQSSNNVHSKPMIMDFFKVRGYDS